MSPKLTAVALAIAMAGTFSGMPAWSQTTTGTSPTLQSASTKPEVKLATQYSPLAGSQMNSESMITGLRDGKNILLITNPTGPNPTAPSVTFIPATGKLGYGDINIALSLAKADLAKLGIANPTPAQLAAALNGGTITTANGTATMAGVLAQRQSGLGWGQIANAMGVKLGALVSASKTDKAGKKDGSTLKVKAEDSSNSRSPGKSEQTQASNVGNKGGNSGGAGGGNSGGGGGGGGGGKGK